ncbi:MAG: ATP-binding cassette domain-containing protein [Proteobacteria bacterium]|nr:ATP-binding cassette domain-containing protein [Pseudomonadota bacterium]NIS72700.1 ATP-binding cassette domain-containing protein [Pseudomonadota bacterium]
MSILEVKGVSKYFGGLAALNDINLTIEEGEIRGIIGPNGAGKTTLFNVISGVYQPTSGQIFYLEGKRIDGLSSDRIAEMGLVRTFQRTALYHNFTVLRNVTIARHLHARENIFGVFAGTVKKMEEENVKKALEIVEFMGLGRLKNELAANLPHGHQRALGIAIALACEPKLLLLDEPLTGMTPTEKAHMIDLIKKVHQKSITILIVEHDMRSVMELCNYISVLDFGKLLAEGVPAEIQNDETVITAYLGTEDILSLGGEEVAT